MTDVGFDIIEGIIYIGKYECNNSSQRKHNNVQNNNK